MDTSRQHIRGSSMLLAGRLLAVGINFTGQVLLVRYLSTVEYGVWAYALSVVGLFHGFAALGLDKVVDRFVPIYHEQRRYDRLFGTILLIVLVILCSSGTIIAAFYLFPSYISDWLNQDALPLLFVVLYMIPLDALDALLIKLFASFASPRAIFFRKHVLGPALKLSVVVLLIASDGHLVLLSYGYVAAAALGVLICAGALVRVMKRQGLFEHVRGTRIEMPTRELFGFALPLMSSETISVLIYSANVILLGYFHSAEQVAFFKVVVPVAAMNEIVMATFALLFTSGAARLFAKDDRAGIQELYWRTTIWMAVLSFPVFALTFGAARPLTIFFYGERYSESGTILAILSVGYYFLVLLGLNAHTLRVFGQLRYIVRVNMISAVVTLSLNLLLIPPFGAQGAAVATTASMIAHHAMRQAALHLVAGGGFFNRKYLPVYLIVVPSALVLFGVQLVALSNIYMGGILAIMMSAGVLFFSRNFLNIAQTFPELLRLPLFRRGRA
jgi:O-antigen/teichoic acid export membrane protein